MFIFPQLIMMAMPTGMRKSSLMVYFSERWLEQNNWFISQWQALIHWLVGLILHATVVDTCTAGGSVIISGRYNKCHPPHLFLHTYRHRSTHVYIPSQRSGMVMRTETERHFDDISITGGAGSCHLHTFLCSRWWKYRQNDHLSVT